MSREPEDRILNACLEELLGSRRPPDLKASILNAWDERRGAGGNSNGHTNGRRRSAVDFPDHACSMAPVATSRRRPPEAQQVSPSGRRRWAWLALALTLLIAAGLGAAALYWRVPQPGEELARREPAERRAPSASPPSSPQPPAAHSTASSPSDPDEGGSSAFDKPAPFTADASPVLPPEAAPAPAPEVGPPLNDEQIVALINGQLRRSWEDRGLVPSPEATEDEWCRRVFLRLVGRIPTSNELERFARDERSDKRRRLVDTLLESDAYVTEYVAHWSQKWSNILIGRSGGLDPKSLSDRDGLRMFLESALEHNRPLNEWVFELISATGSARPDAADFNGAVNFLLSGLNDRATLATSRIARIFLGESLNCAQCHNHPSAAWDQHDFWQLNACLRQAVVQIDPQTGPRLVNRDFPGEGRGSHDGEIYYQRPDGQLKVVFPALPDGTMLSHDGHLTASDRRMALARWVSQSPHLARAAVNRVWSQFFGFGFTRPIDDIGPHNPATHPQLLDALAQQFRAHGYNLRKLQRWIALSDAFGLSSRIASHNSSDAPEWGNAPQFSRYYTRQLGPEEVYQSLLTIARGAQAGQSEAALQARQAWLAQLSSSMGTDDGEETHVFDGGVRQSLLLMNSPLMHQAVDAGAGSTLDLVAHSDMTLDDKIEHLFLAAVSRKPSGPELQLARRVAQSRGADQQIGGLQDVWWALLNSNEFILDH